MRNMILPLLFAAALTAQAQRFSFGFKAGAPVTEALPDVSGSSSIVDTGRWTVGPTVELRLFGSLSFEADALYRGYRYQESGGFDAVIQAGTGISTTTALFSSYRQNAKEWDIPLLLKYRFHFGAVRPFVDAGETFAHVSSDFTGSVTCLGTTDSCNASGLSPYFHAPSTYNSSVNRRGPTAGLGVELKYWRIKIAPEVRYMHLDRPGVNEVTVMAGFTF